MIPGDVQIYFSVEGKRMALERNLRIGELVLRLAVLGFGATAGALVASAHQMRSFFSLEKKARFTDMKVLEYLVVANGVAAGYSLLQGGFCVVRMMKGSVIFSKGLAWAIFSCDQVMAYVTLSAVAAATQSAVIGQFGQAELQWMKICNLYKKFCTQEGEGLVSALMASLVMIILSCFSAFNLFRLYGNKKVRQASNGSW